MKTIQTIKQHTTATLVGLMLAVLFAVAGLLAVQNGSSRLAAVAVAESGNSPADALVSPIDTVEAFDAAKAKDSARTVHSTVKHTAKRTANPVVENRMTEEAEAAMKSLGKGEASYYGRGFAGRPTANGETFKPAEMTAAHRTLPFGSKVRVTNTNNGRSIVVRVNDRGPYAHNRVIDLSQGAAEKIGMISTGTAQVKLELIS